MYNPNALFVQKGCEKMGAEPQVGVSADGVTPMHYSVGAVIEQDGKYLLMNRVKPPFGFAGFAGHVDEGEAPEVALDREVLEEGGLRVTARRLLFEEEVPGNECRRGVTTHYWRLYRCTVEGDIERAVAEAKSIDWYTPEQMATMTLEPVWEYWFKKLGVIPA